MSAVNLDVNSPSALFSQLGVIPEDEFFGLEVQHLWFFQDDSDGLLFEFFSLEVEMFDDFEMDLLVLYQEGLDLVQGLKCVDGKDLIEELVMGRSVVL